MGPPPRKFKPGPRVLDFEDKKTSRGRQLKAKPAGKAASVPPREEPPTKKRKYHQYSTDNSPLTNPTSSTPDHPRSTPQITNLGQGSQLPSQIPDTDHWTGPLDPDDSAFEPPDYDPTVLTPTIEELAKDGFHRSLLEPHEAVNTSQGKVSHPLPLSSQMTYFAPFIIVDPRIHEQVERR